MGEGLLVGAAIVVEIFLHRPCGDLMMYGNSAVGTQCEGRGFLVAGFARLVVGVAESGLLQFVYPRLRKLASAAVPSGRCGIAASRPSSKPGWSRPAARTVKHRRPMLSEPSAALSNAAVSRTVLLAPTVTMCRHDFLIAYSCKCRGVCPSCNTRRMAETAAHLVDHVFPLLPVRQWVPAVPKRLRTFLQRARRCKARCCAFSSPWWNAACANLASFSSPPHGSGRSP